MLQIEVTGQVDGRVSHELASLVDAATRADGHEPLGEHKFLRLEHGADRGAALLARDEGRLVGYGHALRYEDAGVARVSLEIVVHPDARRRGVGRALLDEGVAHARTQRASRIDVWAYNDSAATERMASTLGFSAGRRLLHLHRHVGAGVAPVPAPPDVRVRPFRAGIDDGAWLALNSRIFADHPENGTWTREDLRARIAQPWFDADDFLLLEDRDGLAAFCWLKVDQRGDDGRVGEIYVIGVAPDRQGRGLARYLLAKALERLESRDARVAAIYVDASNLRALRLYQMYGFHHHHVDVCYSLDLDALTLGILPEAAAA